MTECGKLVTGIEQDPARSSDAVKPLLHYYCFRMRFSLATSKISLVSWSVNKAQALLKASSVLWRDVSRPPEPASSLVHLTSLSLAMSRSSTSGTPSSRLRRRSCRHPSRLRLPRTATSASSSRGTGCSGRSSCSRRPRGRTSGSCRCVRSILRPQMFFAESPKLQVCALRLFAQACLATKDDGEMASKAEVALQQVLVRPPFAPYEAPCELAHVSATGARPFGGAASSGRQARHRSRRQRRGDLYGSVSISLSKRTLRAGC